MSYRRTVFITTGCAGALLVLRIVMANQVAVWTAENRILSFPERLLVAVGQAAHLLIVPLVVVAVAALWLGRPPRTAE